MIDIDIGGKNTEAEIEEKCLQQDSSNCVWRDYFFSSDYYLTQVSKTVAINIVASTNNNPEIAGFPSSIRSAVQKNLGRLVEKRDGENVVDKTQTAVH